MFINQIATNTSIAKCLLGLIPASGIIGKGIQNVKNDRFLTLREKRNLTLTLAVVNRSLIILGTLSFISLPLTPQKKALFWLVSSLIVASPCVLQYIYETSESKTTKIIVNISNLIIAKIVHLWAAYMVSVAIGIGCFGQSKSGHSLSAVTFVTLYFLNNYINPAPKANPSLLN